MTRPLRIFQVCSSLAWGGTEMHLPILASKLVERGHTVLAVCHPDGKIVRETEARRIPTATLRLGAYLSPVTTAQLVRLIRRDRPDILHLHLSRDLWQAVPAARLAGCGRVVLTKHVGSFVRKHDVLHRWLYRRVDRVLTVSDVLRQNVIETCPIPPERVLTVHHALDIRKYDPSRCQPDAVRRELGLAPDDLVIGTVGRITPGKGYEEFLQAGRLIRDAQMRDGTGRGVKFLIVGNASYGEEAYYDRIVSLARDLGLGQDVIFAGYRRDIPEVLSAMDVFLFPSRAEGLGATLIEAMAMQRACVSTNSDGTADIIEHGVTGLTVPPGDAEAFARATLTILRDHALQRRMAAAARRCVEKKFDLEAMTSKIESVYESVA
ncbi:MAG: glycosyltransferase family 4 protein [Candidatus Latescibacteria bacterium]|nr:glycosyltransferase family 4 protein [Candidatus Latescibacterota bacterium]